MNDSALTSFSNYSIHFSFLLLLQVHMMASSLNLLVYLCFGGKQDAEYASGVSRPCYSCNTRYMHWIYSMHTVFSDPRTWLYTCVMMHMLNLPRAGLNVARRHTVCVFSHAAIFIKLKKWIIRRTWPRRCQGLILLTGQAAGQVFMRKASRFCWTWKKEADQAFSIGPSISEW